MWNPEAMGGVRRITLAVDDLNRALAFYREGLGFESPGVVGTEFPGDDAHPSGAVAMFRLHDGLILAVWPRSELAKDASVPLQPPKTGEFSIGLAVASRAGSTGSSARLKPPAPP